MGQAKNVQNIDAYELKENGWKSKNIVIYEILKTNTKTSNYSECHVVVM